MDGAVEVDGDMRPFVSLRLLDAADFVEVGAVVVRTAQCDEIAGDRIFVYGKIKVDKCVLRGLKIEFKLRDLHEINMFQRNFRAEIAAGIRVAESPDVIGESDFRALVAVP